MTAASGSRDPQAFRLIDGFPSTPPGRFARGLGEGPGLSLSHSRMDNPLAIQRFARREDQIDTSNAQRPVRRVTLVDEELGLRLRAEYIYYPEHSAVLFGAELENIGTRLLERMKDLLSLDLAFDLSGAEIGDPTVHTIGGGVTHWFFPPKAYRLDEYRILGPVNPREPLRIDSGGTGRSSDGHLPFFYVEDRQGESGIYCGLEWSGLWRVDFTRTDLPSPTPWAILGPNKTLYIRGGIEEVDLTLAPGERLQMPRVLLGFYEGSIHAGRNALRRFLWETWAPLHNGTKPLPPVLFNQHGAFGVKFDEAFMRKQVDVAAEIGIEYFEIDAGWYAGCPEVFSTGVGNWEREALERFPQGVRAFSDYVRSKGMQYGTWFDVERAYRDTDMTRDHPDWLLWVDEDIPDKRASVDVALVDFGRREVQDWAIELINRRIRQWDVRWMRYDNNIGPQAYWARHDAPGQRGRLQIGHIRGAWRLLETIVKDNPQLILEGCSSGGRRIDLGTLARAHSYWMSDHNQNTHVVRTQHSGALTVLPGIYLNSRIVYRGHDYPDHFYHSHFGGALMFSEDLASWSRHEREVARKHVEVYKSIRHLLNKDYYPLFPHPRDTRCWDGWQFNDPSTGEGFVLGFRMESPSEVESPRLRGLIPEARYLVENPYTGEEVVESGRSLMDRGMPFGLAPNSSRLLRYRLR